MVSTVISYFYIFINYEIQLNDDIVMKSYLIYFFNYYWRGGLGENTLLGQHWHWETKESWTWYSQSVSPLSLSLSLRGGGLKNLVLVKNVHDFFS